MDKTKSILLSGLFFVSAIFSSHAANKVHDLKFNLAGVKNTIVFLGCTFGDKDYIQDTAKVDEKGNCEFSGDKDMPGGVYFIMLKSKTKFFEFIIDKDQKFSMSADTVDFIKSMKVTGSEENKLFYEYLHYITIKHDELDTLQKQAKNGPDKDGAKVKLDTLNAQVTRYKLGFIHTHSDMLLSK